MKATTQNNLTITLADQNEIHRGGEGRILLIPELPHTVAKIYHNPQTTISLQQVKALKILDSQYFVKPLSLIYPPHSSEAIGFTMDYLGKDFFPLAALFSAPFCQRKQIGGTEKMKIIQQIQTAVNQGHQHGIIIGDLSGLNLLVNDKHMVKFIDTDAYQTPTQPHSGVLYDEIRDHYFHGRVSKESDYFALSVIVFQLLTFVHPFKGIHQHYKNLAERMIHQIPVFANDPKLKIPKCYHPIADPILQQQFEAIFMNGHRAPLQLTTVAPTPQQQVKALPKVTLQKGKLNIHSFYTLQKGEFIENAHALQKRLLLKTNLQYLIFEASNQGYVPLQCHLSRHEADHLFLGNQHILAKKGEKLFVLEPSQKQFHLLQNFSFTSQSRWVQFTDILAVIEENYLKLVYLDTINQTFVRVEQTPIFGQGVHTSHQGMWQTVGGKTYLFYHSGKRLSSVLFDGSIKELQIFDNHGTITMQQRLKGKKETTLQHLFFSIENLQCQISSIELPHFKTIAYKKLKENHGLIFEPADDKLLIRRTQDFAILQEMPCAVLADDSQFFHTQAGIIAVNTDGVYLLNSQ